MVAGLFEAMPPFLAEDGGLYTRSGDAQDERQLATKLVDLATRGPNMTGLRCVQLFDNIAAGIQVEASRKELDALHPCWKTVYASFAACDEVQRGTLRVLCEKRLLVLGGCAQ